MQENEFNQRLLLINDIIKQAASLREDILNKNKILPLNMDSLVKSLNTRDNSFKDYLKYIKEFNFTEDSSPVDIFPGIRTALDSVDPEELEQKTTIMKNQAQEIENQSKRISSLKESVMGSYKRLISTLIEYLKLEDQIYELQLDLLKDLDSPYDIGQIARNS